MKHVTFSLAALQQEFQRTKNLDMIFFQRNLVKLQGNFSLMDRKIKPKREGENYFSIICLEHGEWNLSNLSPMWSCSCHVVIDPMFQIFFAKMGLLHIASVLSTLMLKLYTELESFWSWHLVYMPKNGLVTLQSSQRYVGPECQPKKSQLVKL